MPSLLLYQSCCVGDVWLKEPEASVHVCVRPYIMSPVRVSEGCCGEEKHCERGQNNEMMMTSMDDAVKTLMMNDDELMMDVDETNKDGLAVIV